MLARYVIVLEGNPLCFLGLFFSANMRRYRHANACHLRLSRRKLTLAAQGPAAAELILAVVEFPENSYKMPATLMESKVIANSQ